MSIVDNFKRDYQDILTRCNKKLKKRTSRIHINDENVNNLLECLYELDDIAPKNITLKAVIPLIILYGLKLGK